MKPCQCLWALCSCSLLRHVGTSPHEVFPWALSGHCPALGTPYKDTAGEIRGRITVGSGQRLRSEVQFFTACDGYGKQICKWRHCKPGWDLLQQNQGNHERWLELPSGPENWRDFFPSLTHTHLLRSFLGLTLVSSDKELVWNTAGRLWVLSQDPFHDRCWWALLWRIMAGERKVTGRVRRQLRKPCTSCQGS